MASSYLVQEEDGVSRFTLEDGTGFILLEEAGEAVEVGGIVEEQARYVSDEAEVMLTVVALAAKRRRL